MTLEILTPYEYRTFIIAWLEVNTGIGNLIIQPGHAPAVMTLTDNSTAIATLPAGNDEVIVVTRGVVEISRSRIRLLMN